MNQTISEIYYLLQKEFRSEFRHRAALGGVLLYVFATVFVVYSGFARLQADVWNVQYWIIILFASIHAVWKSFAQDSGNRQMYLYTLVSPQSVILAKLLYNFLLIAVISFLTYAGLSFFTMDPVRDYAYFALAAMLGSIGFSIIFTFTAAIAYRGSQQTALMSILSFPIIIPVLLVLIKISADAIGLIKDTAVWSDYMMLLGIDLLLFSLALLLFPFLWKD
jgi:heme exporter protein B